MMVFLTVKKPSQLAQILFFLLLQRRPFWWHFHFFLQGDLHVYNPDFKTVTPTSCCKIFWVIFRLVKLQKMLLLSGNVLLYFVIRWKKGGPTWQKSVLCTMFKNLPKCLISNNLTQPTHFVVCILKLVSPNSNILKLTSPKSPQYPTSYPTRPLNLALDR